MIAQSCIILLSLRTLSSVRFTNLNIFGTRKVKSTVHSQFPTVRNRRSTNTATKIMVTWLTLRINDQQMFFTISLSMLGFTSFEHSFIAEAIKNLPGKTYSSSIFFMATEESLASKSRRAFLMTVQNESFISCWTTIIAK